jgi:hypothetical protein
MVGDLVLAVLRLELAADVAVELVVEGLHVLPQPLDVGLELGRRHVVAGPPHRPDVVEADLPRPLVGQIDVADEPVLHRHRNGVPARPGLGELGVVVRAGEDAGQVVEVQALRPLGPLVGPREVLAQRRAGGGAVVPLAVHRGHRRLDAGELGALGGVVRGGDGLGERQEVEAARDVRRERGADRIEAPRHP